MSEHHWAWLVVVALVAGCTSSDVRNSESPVETLSARPSLAVQAMQMGGEDREAYGHVFKSWHAEPTCGWGFAFQNVTLPEVTRDGRHHGVFTDDADIANRMFDVMADRNLSVRVTYSTAYTPGCGSSACAFFQSDACPDEGMGGWILLGIRSITNMSTNTTTTIEERAR